MDLFMSSHLTNMYKLIYNYDFNITILKMDYTLYQSVYSKDIILETDVYSLLNPQKKPELNIYFDLICDSNENIGFMKVLYV